MVFKAQSAIAKAGDFLTDRFLSKEFADATNAGADRAVNSIDRATYRAHARLEEERNGWLQGMRLTMVNDLVGTGFKLRVVGSKRGHPTLLTCLGDIGKTPAEIKERNQLCLVKLVVNTLIRMKFRSCMS